MLSWVLLGLRRTLQGLGWVVSGRERATESSGGPSQALVGPVRLTKYFLFWKFGPFEKVSSKENLPSIRFWMGVPQDLWEFAPSPKTENPATASDN